MGADYAGAGNARRSGPERSRDIPGEMFLRIRATKSSRPTAPQSWSTPARTPPRPDQAASAADLVVAADGTAQSVFADDAAEAQQRRRHLAEPQRGEVGLKPMPTQSVSHSSKNYLIVSPKGVPREGPHAHSSKGSQDSGIEFSRAR